MHTVRPSVVTDIFLDIIHIPQQKSLGQPWTLKLAHSIEKVPEVTHLTSKKNPKNPNLSRVRNMMRVGLEPTPLS